MERAIKICFKKGKVDVKGEEDIMRELKAVKQKRGGKTE